MKRRFHLYAIGNALIDLQYRVSESAIQELQLTKGAMRLVKGEEQAELIRRFINQDLNQASGGSAANSIIALAQLGGKAAYGCVVGDDSFGGFYLEEMELLGVELHNQALKNVQSGTCVVLITPDAERTMNTHLGASAYFGLEHVSEEHIADSEWIYIEGYLLSSPTGQLAASKATELAKKHGTKVAVTFSDGFIVDSFRQSLTDVVENSDLVFANLNEAKLFTGGEEAEDIFKRLCHVVPNVAMTMSEKGARVFFGGRDYRISAFETKATDDTGAGDMFAGAFLYGITHRWSPEDAGKLACFLASKVVSQLGPRLKTDVRALVSELPFVSL